MSDFGMRRDRLPANLDGLRHSRWQAASTELSAWAARQIGGSGVRADKAIAAVGNFADPVQLQLEQLRSCITRLLEFVRRKVFSRTLRSKTEYEEASSEISTFLISCRRIFWALAIFSGLSNLLMLNGSFFMLQVY